MLQSMLGRSDSLFCCAEVGVTFFLSFMAVIKSWRGWESKSFALAFCSLNPAKACDLLKLINHDVKAAC